MSEAVLEGEVVDAHVVPDDEPTPPPPPAPVEVVPYRQGANTDLLPAGSPTEKIEQAAAVATALDRVVQQQGMRTKIGRAKVVLPDGREEWRDKYHVNVEAWQTLATLLGCAVVERYARPWVNPSTGQVEKAVIPVEVFKYAKGTKAQAIRNGTAAVEGVERYDATGYSWEAVVDVFKDGTLIGSASGMCSITEQSWKDRDDHNRRSMAVTRATGRAVASAARWIVTLAGYSATPAEEMPTQQADPEPESQGPAFGPAATDSQQGQAVRALRAALEMAGSATSFEHAMQVIAKMTDDAGGYLPAVSARAVGHLAAAMKAAAATPAQDATGATVPGDGDPSDLTAEELAELRERAEATE